MHMKPAALNSHSLSSGMYGGQTEEESWTGQITAGPVTGPSLDRWPVRASQTGASPVWVPRSVRSVVFMAHRIYVYSSRW